MEIRFAERIKELRRERGNTQEELAEHLGISIQAVSKWERGDGMPDITLLPHIASYYDTTVDFLLGCDSIRKQEDIAVFMEKAQVLINKGKRKERLELCRAYQKKYPNDESVLYELMYDLFSVSWRDNSEEIISIAEKLLHSSNTERHFGAVQLLAFTHAKLGNYDTAVKYARSIPTNRDILRNVLKGEELVEHCRWYFWQMCDKMYQMENCLANCREADIGANERYVMTRSVYDVFNIVFSDGDFGFWEERLARLSYDMAKSSAELGELDRAISELCAVCEHTEKFENFTSIDHTSPLIRGLHYDISQSGRSSEQTLAAEVLRELERDKRFECLKGDARYHKIKQRLKDIG